MGKFAPAYFWIQAIYTNAKKQKNCFWQTYCANALFFYIAAYTTSLKVDIPSIDLFGVILLFFSVVVEIQNVYLTKLYYIYIISNKTQILHWSLDSSQQSYDANKRPSSITEEEEEDKLKWERSFL
jgi:hypothetical protein